MYQILMLLAVNFYFILFFDFIIFLLRTLALLLHLNYKIKFLTWLKQSMSKPNQISFLERSFLKSNGSRNKHRSTMESRSLESPDNSNHEAFTLDLLHKTLQFYPQFLEPTFVYLGGSRKRFSVEQSRKRRLWGRKWWTPLWKVCRITTQGKES